MGTLLITLLLLLFMPLGAFPMGLIIFGIFGSALAFGMAPVNAGLAPAVTATAHSQVTSYKNKRGYQMNSPLTETQIQTALSQFPGWSYENQAFSKRFQFQNFREAISFIVRLSFEAEALNHHPELKNVYQTVEIRLTTHDAGNQVTGKDLALLEAIEGFNWLK
jgi:4a-hydroxytetrahydrobiopterin dehydratase